MSSAEDTFPFLRLLSGWGTVSGPGIFMFRSLLSGASAAAVVGTTSAMLGSIVWGTAALPFLIGSSLGFAAGSFRWYEVVTREAMTQLELYPLLLRAHICASFPRMPELRHRGPEWYTPQRFRSSWQLRSMLVVGSLSAEPAIREIRASQEERLIARYAERKDELCEKQGEVKEEEDCK